MITKTNLIKLILSLVISLLIAYIPNYPLSIEATHTLFILVLATFLWISEAVQSFAVSFLIIFLEIILLGSSENWQSWKIYLQPWAESIIFLFLGGFIIAEASTKTGLDKYIANRVLKFVGEDLNNVVSAILFLTFVMSMFVSNTATAVIMLTIISPILISVSSNGAKSLVLAILIGANIGGIGTIIGTPPNAIAIGILGDKAPSFLEWMYIALPPAIIIAILLRIYLLFVYPSNGEKVSLSALNNNNETFSREKIYVTAIFFITVILWLTGSIHHMPTSVIAFIPIVAFTIMGILSGKDINNLRWDIIILLVGGLSLGFAISHTGLDKWIGKILEIDNISATAKILIAIYTVAIISNFMSNTSASNIILPLVVASTSSAIANGTANITDLEYSVIAVAIGASFAMALPISTPPNAILFGTGKIETKDLLKMGILTLIFAPLLIIIWLEIYKII